MEDFPHNESMNRNDTGAENKDTDSAELAPESPQKDIYWRDPIHRRVFV